MNPLGNGTNPLHDGTNPLHDGIDSLGKGMSSLDDEVSSLSDGMSSLSKGMSSLGDGVSSLGEGIDSLGDGVKVLGEILCGGRSRRGWRRQKEAAENSAASSPGKYLLLLDHRAERGLNRSERLIDLAEVLASGLPEVGLAAAAAAGHLG